MFGTRWHPGARALIVLAIAAAADGTADAQDVAPPGWERIGAAPAIGYRNPSAPQEVIMLLGPFPRTKPSVEAQAIDTAEAMTASMGCGAFDAAAVRLTADRATAYLPSRDGGCTVATRFDPAGTTRAALIRGDLTGSSRGAFVRALGWAGYVADAPIAPAETRASAPSMSAGDEEQALQSAIRDVPAESRPVHVVLHGTGSFSGWPAVYVYNVTTYLLFGNGWATACADWDPGLLRPTPESLGKDYPTCGLHRWRATAGAGVELQSEKGDWFAPTGVRGELRAFKPGETIEIAFGNVGGTGFAGGPGGVSTSLLSGSDLRMTADGRVAVGRWSSVVVAGPTIGGGGGGKSMPITGRYRLDGNIIALRDASGTISRGFIAGVPLAGQPAHIYLNGKHFWAEDD